MREMTKQLVLKRAIALQTARARAAERLSDDRGEVGSWMLVAAFLALVAATIGPEIADWINNNADAITGTGTASR